MPYILEKIRKELHANPELSGEEENTSNYIARLLEEINPDQIMKNVGGFGVMAVFEAGVKSSESIAFRADIDALPIPEANEFEHKSKNLSVAHKCGHDGHSTVLLGFGEYIESIRDQLNKNVVLLFQAAEETAQGAKAMTEDDRFAQLNIKYIFGWHNLPGFPLHSIIIKEGIFSSASTGMIIRLIGKTSHAGHPENGISPMPAAAAIIDMLQGTPALKSKFSESALVTVIGAKLGEKAFGTTPGYGEIYATFRSHTNQTMESMTKGAESAAKNIAIAYGLNCEVEYVEYFPANENHTECFKIIKSAAEISQKEIVNIIEPFPWSEDFAFFSKIAQSGFYGIGSGIDHPQLHNPDYDFPDEIIPTAIDIYKRIFININNK